MIGYENRQILRCEKPDERRLDRKVGIRHENQAMTIKQNRTSLKIIILKIRGIAITSL
jgi:hypothetical protein